MAETVFMMKDDARLEQIYNQISRLAKGDFLVQENVSEKGDELDSIIVGLNILGEELNSKLMADHDNERRTQLLMDAMVRTTQFDFSQSLEVSEKGDELDALAV